MQERNIHFRKKAHNVLYPVHDEKWLIPVMILWLLFYGIPFLFTAMNSLLFYSNNDLQFGLVNYARLFQDSFFLLAVKNNIFFFLIAIGLSMFLGLITARLLFYLKGFRWIVPVLVFPLLFPSPSIAAVWSLIFSNGSQFVRMLNPPDQIWNYTSLVLLYLWKYVGAATVIYLLGFFSIDPQILHAAYLDGAKERELFRFIQLPLLKNFSRYAFYFLLIAGIKVFRESYLLYGAYPPQSLFFISHYLNLSIGRLDNGLLSAAGITFSIFILVPVDLILFLKLSGDGESL